LQVDLRGVRITRTGYGIVAEIHPRGRPRIGAAADDSANAAT
jgi:hypothetical protein